MLERYLLYASYGSGRALIGLLGELERRGLEEEPRGLKPTKRGDVARK